MSQIKKLAGHTLWYGVPTILSRFLNYLLSILFFGIFKPGAFGVITTLYAYIPFLNIIFTYGLETAFFRFSESRNRQAVYNTLSVSILVSTFCFTLPLLFFRQQVADFIELGNHPEYVVWCAGIVFFDTLSTLPLAMLRLQERPKRFAFIRVMNVLANIVLTVIFYLVAPHFQNSFWFSWYNADMGVGYVLIANFAASIVTFLLLLPQLLQVRYIFSKTLWKEIMQYSMPLVVVGFGGMINEMLSRTVFLKVSPLPQLEKEHDLGVFGANYKLAVLITIFIQVFKMAAEPFFFAQSKSRNAPETYARVMKYFVLACCFMFLGIALFLDVWKLLLTYKNPEFGEGIHIVPVLAMAQVFLGIYYNQSIWYKLSNKNWIGARITLTGAVITVLLNIWWIPRFGYTGSAWATFVCYAYMMGASYYLGQRYYPVPYEVSLLLGYLLLAGGLYALHYGVTLLTDAALWRILPGVLCFAVFTGVVTGREKETLKSLPLIRRWVS